MLIIVIKVTEVEREEWQLSGRIHVWHTDGPRFIPWHAQLKVLR